MDNLMSNLEKVAAFHRAFNNPIGDIPGVPGFTLRKLRAKLLLEEVEEFVEASGLLTAKIYSLFEELQTRLDDLTIPMVVDEGCVCNMTEAADALGDIEYVTHGASLVWGFPAQKIFDIIHESNMSKLGVDGQPVKRADGKILKGPNYCPPQGKIREILYPGFTE